MANTTFNGPVRSENGFKNVIKSATTGDLTSEMTLSVYTATVTVANGATTGKESAIGIPSNFIPMAVMVKTPPLKLPGIPIGIPIGIPMDPKYSYGCCG